MLSKVDFNSQGNLLVIACSVGMGLSVSVVPGLFSQVPESMKVLTDSGIVAGSLTAIILNIVFNMIPSKEGKQAPVEVKKAA